MPEDWRADYERLPPALRALLDAEMAAGNEIADVGHSFPAPPAGAFFRLNRAVTTRSRADGDGLIFHARNSSLYSGEWTDAKRFFFVLEPAPPETARVATRTEETPLRRFEKSMVIDYEKWHDGIGYDLDAIRGASAVEREQIERLLQTRGARDWRDVEALAALGTAASKAALRKAAESDDASVRMAVSREAPDAIDARTREESLLRALREAEFYGGLTQELAEAREFHPPAVIEELFWEPCRAKAKSPCTSRP
jgi:hypothetical protein